MFCSMAVRSGTVLLTQSPVDGASCSHVRSMQKEGRKVEPTIEMTNGAVPPAMLTRTSPHGVLILSTRRVIWEMSGGRMQE